MGKDSHKNLVGQPVFKQMIQIIPRDKFDLFGNPTAVQGQLYYCLLNPGIIRIVLDAYRFIGESKTDISIETRRMMCHFSSFILPWRNAVNPHLAK